MITSNSIIPNNWRHIKLKYVAQLVSSRAESRPDGLPYVGMENIESHTGRLISAQYQDDEQPPDGSLQEAAAVNPEGKFALLFSGLLETLFIERMEQNEDIFARFMNERDFQGLVSDWISRKVYGRLRGTTENDSSKPAGFTSILGL